MPPDTSRLTSAAPDLAFCSGRHQFKDKQLQRIAGEQGGTAAWAEAFNRVGVDVPLAVQGDFAVAICGPYDRTYLAVDRFAIRSL